LTEEKLTGVNAMDETPCFIGDLPIPGEYLPNPATPHDLPEKPG
jgi:hypothetical protein